MNLTKMIAELREQKEALEQTMIMLERLARSQGKRRGRPPSFLSNGTARKRRPFSAETRKKMAAAQRKRWAAIRKKQAS